VQRGLIGGFDAKDLGQDLYRVRFAGNSYTSRETVQTYWLYRSAELAVENGFTGFEVLSDVSFATRGPGLDDGPWQALGYKVPASNSPHIPASPIEVADESISPSGGKDAVSARGERIRVAASVPVFIYSLYLFRRRDCRSRNRGRCPLHQEAGRADATKVQRQGAEGRVGTNHHGREMRNRQCLSARPGPMLTTA
jgi:hypothetical protein